MRNVIKTACGWLGCKAYLFVALTEFKVQFAAVGLIKVSF